MTRSTDSIELSPQELDALRLQSDTERILRGESVAMGDCVLAHADEYESRGRQTPRHYSH